MLLDLSVELLHEIGGQPELDRSDHRSLRRVCKALSFAMEPLVFSYILLRSNELRLERELQILQTLATGKTRWSQYVKTLRITQHRNQVEEDINIDSNLPDFAMQELLASALGFMRNVRTVMWDVDECDPSWQVHPIRDFLSTLALLDDLQLEVQGAVACSLPMLSCLKKLKIRTSYYPSHWKPAPIVQQALQLIPHNPTLTSLHLSSSHKSDRLADDFFCTVLPRHANSLIELSCTAEYESGWSFGSHNVDAISDLHKLARLEMNVNAEDVVEVQPSMNSVALLLRTTALLPALRSLTICYAKSENTRGSGFDIRSMNHTKYMEEGITIAVQNFCSHSETPVIVRAVNDLYQLTPVGFENGMNPFSAIAIALEFVKERTDLFGSKQERLIVGVVPSVK
ncbi:hypothetical protein C8R44DRAFT_855572 [Mycena epipterygia]|nr:hypothetical protein C8R44DRAFT_855572 [Mycena epipterygia]